MQLFSRPEPATDGGSFSDGSAALAALLGDSLVMRRLRETIVRVAASDRPALVLGPTGSGKELVVRAIHAHSAHAQEKFLDLNCGAIPGALIEAQLFGHQRGAFTGAEHDQIGFLSAVERGTLFLDEIAELPINIQATLLRVLETRMFRAVGSVEERIFSGRLIAATHADLERRVASGTFREDLLFRLNVLAVQVPPLSARREDIPQLIDHFVTKQKRAIRFTPDARDVLRTLPWPGNVRQLANTIDRVAVFSQEDVVDVAELQRITGIGGAEATPAALVGELVRAVMKLPLGDKLAAIQTQMLDEALAATRGNKSAAARLLGVHRKRFERLIARRQKLS